ncbi:PREDICTED: sphingolipid 10-desaturase-like [Priapulus caudatus]|uniref:Sphingolipid 10-desaturase-like n=1 Tax=Priapulus caudatus TaxID=37621 RepID=A0ABM1DPZ4_PRICU|nr:PREDICTED: sphingolipid 10-desaturase-like [Priapulus caudatus]
MTRESSLRKRADAERMLPTAPPEVAHRLDASDDTTTASAGDCVNPSDESTKLIGIEGRWYDVTNFTAFHPGGEIIEQFVGCDATAAFHAFHQGRNVLKHRRPVGSYTPDDSDPARRAFENLRQYFDREGYFRASWRWYPAKFAVIAALLAAAVYAIACRQEALAHACGGLLLASFWQQCGFLMHDAMHTHLTNVRRIDHAVGVVVGTCCIGISATWWRDEHFVHHALTNVVDYARRFADPQMWEATWAQDAKLFPYFATRWHRAAVRVQHLTFVPLCVLAGRVAIVVDSFSGRRPWYEWLAAAVHWVCVSWLLSTLPSWREACVVYGIACMGEGVLHIQLLISHYAKPFREQRVMQRTDFYRFQVEANINIANPPWLDWFHGGLNLHIEHHLFPRMPRCHFRRASLHVRRVCKELGIVYDECSWTDAVRRTLTKLKTMSEHFSLDPR